MTLTKRFAASCPSPLGEIWLVARSSGALVELNFRGGRFGDTDRSALERKYEQAGQSIVWDAARLQPALEAMGEYFRGERRSFDLQLEPEGTDFQQRVWAELLKIPYGKTCSYGALAAKLGQPSASRAVGLANGKNPIAIVIPCHRVIGSDGSLTGYAGGVDKKEALLRIEGCLLF